MTVDFQLRDRLLGGGWKIEHNDGQLRVFRRAGMGCALPCQRENRRVVLCKRVLPLAKLLHIVRFRRRVL